MLSTRYVK